jgi:hypothetical protein
VRPLIVVCTKFIFNIIHLAREKHSASPGCGHQRSYCETFLLYIHPTAKINQIIWIKVNNSTTFFLKNKNPKYLLLQMLSQSTLPFPSTMTKIDTIFLYSGRFLPSSRKSGYLFPQKQFPYPQTPVLFHHRPSRSTPIL